MSNTHAALAEGVRAIVRFVEQGERALHVATDADLRDGLVAAACAVASRSPQTPVVLPVRTPRGGGRRWSAGAVELLVRYGKLRTQLEAAGHMAPEPLGGDLEPPRSDEDGLRFFALVLERIAARVSRSGREVVVLLAPTAGTSRLGRELDVLARSTALARVRWLVIEHGEDLSCRSTVERIEGRVADARLSPAARRADMVRRLRGAASCPESARAHGGAGPSRALPAFGAPWTAPQPASPEEASAKCIVSGISDAAASALEERPLEAVRAQAEALGHARRLGARHLEGPLTLALAGYVAAAGEGARAIELVRGSVADAQRDGDGALEIASRMALAGHLLGMRRPLDAEREWVELSRRADQLGDPTSAIDALRVAGEMQVARADEALAAASWRAALEIAERAPAELVSKRAAEVADRLVELCLTHRLPREAQRYAELAAHWRAALRAAGGTSDAR